MQTEAEEGSPSPAASPTAASPTAASPAPEMAQVPNVEGESIEDATSELEAAGFVVSVATKLTNAVDPGDVLLQSVTAGSLLEVGGTIGLIVAKAPPKIPKVVGKTLANAKRALKNAGFEVGNVTQQTSNKKKGTVIAQSPDAGTSAHLGRAVSLVTAKPAPQPSNLALAHDELRDSKQELRETRDKAQARTRKIKTLQRRMNRLATRIAQTEAEVLKSEHRIERLEREMAVLQARASMLQARLDERYRQAYMFGGVPVLYVLTATSAADAASRMSFLNEMNRRDGVLAVKVLDTEDRLRRVEAEVVRGRQVLELKKRSLDRDRRTLRRRMAESRRLLEALHERVEQIQYEISRIRPFAVCPVAGPHAIADGFGILRHHSKKEGGTHVHQGNDITAAMGTPIVAPFDGVAVTTSNEIGGLAVEVHGEFGFVYNAHLSRLGHLGPVEKGEEIGYVGATGNATGPHLHFEWHPDEGPAVDPYDFLLLVCA